MSDGLITASPTTFEHLLPLSRRTGEGWGEG